MEDGSLVEKDLWIDERRGVVLDSQVRENGSCKEMSFSFNVLYSYSKRSSPGSGGQKGP